MEQASRDVRVRVCLAHAPDIVLPRLKSIPIACGTSGMRNWRDSTSSGTQTYRSSEKKRDHRSLGIIAHKLYDAMSPVASERLTEGETYLNNVLEHGRDYSSGAICGGCDDAAAARINLIYSDSVTGQEVHRRNHRFPLSVTANELVVSSLGRRNPASLTGGMGVTG